MINDLQLTALGDFPPANARNVLIPPSGSAQLSLPGDARALEIDGRGTTDELLAFGRTAPLVLSDLLARVAINYGPPETVCATSDMGYSRAGHQATLLASGEVLISGGYDQSGFPVPKLERYVPYGDVTRATAGFVVVDANGATEIESRAALGHAVAVLPSGDLLITGGVPTQGGLPMGQAFEGYTHHDSTGVLIGQAQILLGGPRAFHTATVLADGSVVLLGGCAGFSSMGCDSVLGTSVIYSTATGEFGDGPPLAAARFGHQAFLRGDGKILVVGGGAPAELFDVASGGTMLDGSSLFTGPAALLPTGGALSIGNGTAALWLDGDGLILLPSPPPRTGQTLTALEDGAVLVAGGGAMGFDSTLSIYDPFGAARSLPGPFARRDHSATRLGDGTVLLAGGADPSGATNHAAVFIHTPLGPYTNLPTLTFATASFQESPLEPRRPDHLSFTGGRVQLTAASPAPASSDGRPAELALIAALELNDLQISLSAGQVGGGGAALILGFVSDADYAFVTLAPNQPVTLSTVSASGVQTVKGCSGLTLDPAELPDASSAGALAPLILDWRSGQLQLFSPARRLLQCAPGAAIARGSVGVGVLAGTLAGTLAGGAQFDDLAVTR